MKEKNEIGESKWVVKPLSKISQGCSTTITLQVFKELFPTGKEELFCIRGGEEGGGLLTTTTVYSVHVFT